MSLLSLWRRRRTQPDHRIILLGHRQPERDGLVPIARWEMISPLPPDHLIPDDLTPQLDWVSAQVAAHAAAGSIDEATYDLFDYYIESHSAEEHRLVDHAGHAGLETLHLLGGQGEQHLITAATRLETLRTDQARLEHEAATAYHHLTGLTLPTSEQSPTSQSPQHHAQPVARHATPPTTGQGTTGQGHTGWPGAPTAPTSATPPPDSDAGDPRQIGNDHETWDQRETGDPRQDGDDQPEPLLRGLR